MFGLSETIRIDYQEYLVVIIRSHGIKLFFRLLPLILFFFLLFLFLFPLVRLGMYGIVLFLGGLAIDFFYSIRILVMWYGTCFIVTNQKIITVKRLGYFKKDVCEVPFSQIHEISYHTKGLFQMIFSYGMIQCVCLQPRETLYMNCVGQPNILLEKLSRFIACAKKPLPQEILPELTDECENIPTFKQNDFNDENAL